MELASRQQELLRAIIEEYIETAEPVGSETIVRKYNLGVSPATIRNEMVELTDLGFLKKPYASAGRIPSPPALKFYIQTLMKEHELPVKDEVSIKESLWDNRFEFDKLLKEASKQLSEKTGTLAIANTEGGDTYYYGAASILDMPEFIDIDLTKSILSLLDDSTLLSEIFSRVIGDSDVHILIGDDLEIENLLPCSFVFSNFGAGRRFAGTVGVIGPARMHYPRVVPTVRYFGHLLNEAAASW